MSRPDATVVAWEMWNGPHELHPRLIVNCGKCGTGLGVVVDTDHGPLWLGWLGASRSRRRFRTRVLEKAGHRTTGGNIVPMWVDEWRSWFICECPCPRNSADGRTIHAALRAGRRRVKVPPQPPA